MDTLRSKVFLVEIVTFFLLGVTTGFLLVELYAAKDALANSQEQLMRCMSVNF